MRRKDPLALPFQQGSGFGSARGQMQTGRGGIIGLSSWPCQPREQVQASQSVIKSDAQKYKRQTLWKAKFGQFYKTYNDVTIGFLTIYPAG